MTNAVIIPAAGRGSRTQAKINKVYLRLAGRPVIAHTIEACFAAAVFDQIIVVVAPGEEEIFRRDVLLPWFPEEKITIVTGGRERQDSVANGLSRLHREIDYVCIHDGARPLVAPSLLQRCLAEARKSGAAVAAVPVKDTIKTVDTSGTVVATPDRSRLWAVQTPQAFRRDWLEEAYRHGQKQKLQVTDDATLLELCGYPVTVVLADYSNLKITTADDLALAEALLGRKQAMRVGNGYDVHRLVAGRKLILGGVDIPHTLGLLGHSDADVLVHAIMDAMLGALALGDIGRHFPDTDPRYKNISSLKLLQHVAGLCAEKGYRLSNLDAVIIAQQPKLAPYIEAMRQNIALALDVPVSSISIKATTTEGLGFAGRGEGIAALAAVFLAGLGRSKPGINKKGL
ncbi:MAG: 2-C-methyl-D-erythritol 4-phosphate cytidylyltransferase [Firmicutes bacterium]|jgi:2-C-methyl-D-erythritol 4-phosphate cytidylyltransferase/2-C-methyl-D-erythritol 2,4-cyclodiphosphate synthase|nr:2-C-methyl-D-erythritol 4-phosphate cytidylyltransferase [Bacillota bacterium]